MTIVPFPTTIPSRSAELAQHLREIAAAVESGEAFYDHHAFLLCLTSPTHHEALTFGYQHDLEGWRGAHSALSAIMSANYRTDGGNIRARDVRQYGRPSGSMPVNLAEAISVRKHEEG